MGNEQESRVTQSLPGLEKAEGLAPEPHNME